jgi:hypothetical protein
MRIRLSLLQSGAREFEPLDCHQTVTEIGAKRAKIN